MNEPDPLLAQLGALEREYDDTFPHEWEDVVRGVATAEQVVAARAGKDDPEELAALAQILTPMDEAERDAWVRRLAPHLQAGRSEGEDAGGAAKDGAATLVPLRPRRVSITGLTTALAVAAAAVLVVSLSTMSREPDPAARGSISELPEFSLVVRNQTVHALRSASASAGGDGVDRYQPRSALHWVIQPARATTRLLGLCVLAQREPGAGHDAERRVVRVEGVRVSEHGALELRGTVHDTLELDPGRWTLRFIVAEPATLPEDPRDYDRGGAWSVTDAYALEIVP